MIFYNLWFWRFLSLLDFCINVFGLCFPFHSLDLVFCFPFILWIWFMLLFRSLVLVSASLSFFGFGLCFFFILWFWFLLLFHSLVLAYAYSLILIDAILSYLVWVYASFLFFGLVYAFIAFFDFNYCYSFPSCWFRFSFKNSISILLLLLFIFYLKFYVFLGNFLIIFSVFLHIFYLSILLNVKKKCQAYISLFTHF